ncbi:MAG: hypothetical protein ACEQSB_06565 [Undibacterium sp.]
MSIFTLKTFTLKEIAAIERQDYQTTLNRKAKGDYVAVAFLSGGKNPRMSYRYFSRRMSEIILGLARERILDGAVENDEKSDIIARDLRKKRKPIVNSTQYSKK